jgi:L-serine dehydratase
MKGYESVQELVSAAEDSGKKISQLVAEYQASVMNVTVDEVIEKMAYNINIMRESIEKGMLPDVKSTSGLTGGEAYKIKAAADGGRLLGGELFTTILARATAVAGWNAAMGRIVAAPTAGSCGIIPSVLLSVGESVHADERSITMGMLTAAGIGLVIARNATVSGAEGGCQAECGSASAMAASAAVEIAGGTPEMAADACAIALKNQLGLICDPVAGLVEIPCVKRNASCAANALVAANLALAGVKSAIPADEVIAAMKAVGRLMPATLKETAEGGLANTPTGKALAKHIFGK